MPTDYDPDYIQLFIDVGKIKVWSLLVTAFGDLAPEEGTTISGIQLNALFQAMHIRPEALRVALHRLSKEGWVISERTGRTSDYRLSELGVAETKKVWGRVYKPNYGLNRQWHTAIVPHGLADNSSSAIKLTGQTYIIEKHALSTQKDALSFPFQSKGAPDWVEKKILAGGLDDLSQALLDVLENFPGFQSISNEIEQVAIRTLCLHHWRRIALRDAVTLHLQHYKKGHIRLCHDRVHQLLVEMPRRVAKKSIKQY